VRLHYRPTGLLAVSLAVANSMCGATYGPDDFHLDNDCISGKGGTWVAEEEDGEWHCRVWQT